MGLFLYALSIILDRAIEIYILVIVVRSIMSWFNPDYRHPVVRFFYAVTDPVLAPVRELIHYKLGIRLGSLDISPIVVILALAGLKALVIPWIARLSTVVG